MLHSLPCLFLCLTVAQPSAALEITQPRATYGYLGAMRAKGEGVLPGETVHFTFEIKNLKLDESGKALYSIAIEIRDEQGKLFFEQRPYNSIAINYLGGSSLPCSAHVEIPLNAKPGTYEWKLTIKDRTTKESTSLVGKSKILPADFGIVQVGLFADAESRVPMSAVAVVGDSAYIQLGLVGFERKKDTKQPDLLVSMRIVDEQGKPTMAKAITGEINNNVGPKDGAVTMHFGMTFNRAGRYTVELNAEDRVTGKRSQVRYPVRVLPLE
jgi:hypothetical protein